MSATEWTIGTLKEHYDEKFRSQEKEAERLAEALTQYKAQANEFRGALNDQSGEFLRRTESELALGPIRQQIDELQRARDVQRGDEAARAAARVNAKWLFGVGLTLAIAAVGWYLRR